MTAHAGHSGNARGSANRGRSLAARGLSGGTVSPEGLEQARKLWWKLFGIAGGMMLGPMIKGREAELSPMLKEFSAGVAARPAIADNPCLIPGSSVT